MRRKWTESSNKKFSWQNRKGTNTVWQRKTTSPTDQHRKPPVLISLSTISGSISILFGFFLNMVEVDMTETWNHLLQYLCNYLPLVAFFLYSLNALFDALLDEWETLYHPCTDPQLLVEPLSFQQTPSVGTNFWYYVFHIKYTHGLLEIYIYRPYPSW